ncbi:MAG TPA: hypothetical protein VF706_03470 [Solirubrobacteraceae bacterium]
MEPTSAGVPPDDGSPDVVTVVEVEPSGVVTVVVVTVVAAGASALVGAGAVGVVAGAAVALAGCPAGVAALGSCVDSVVTCVTGGSGVAGFG